MKQRSWHVFMVVEPGPGMMRVGFLLSTGRVLKRHTVVDHSMPVL